MAHFAELDENNVVVRVIVVANSDCGDVFPASESVGQAFIASLGITGNWLQTSYNNGFRTRYAGIGAVYVPEHDMFTASRPFPSWTLDANHDWQPPVPKPEIDGWWEWNETALEWQR